MITPISEEDMPKYEEMLREKLESIKAEGRSGIKLLNKEEFS